MRTPADLRSYQKRCARSIYHAPDNVGRLLFVDMGLGKTISTLTAARGLLRTQRRGCAVAVMPKRVLDAQTWQKEAQLWSHTKDLRFRVLTTRKPRDPKTKPVGPQREQAKAAWAAAKRATLEELDQPADLYLTEYDNLRWLAQLAGTPKKPGLLWLPDMLILDEATFIKSHKSMRFKALKFRLRRFFPTIVELTGTPMPQSLAELWAQVYIADGGARLGTSFDRFHQQYFEPQPDKNGRIPFRVYKYRPREHAFEDVLERIADITVRLDAEDWLKLPRIVPNIVPVQLPAAAYQLYKRHERNMFTRLSELKFVNAVNAATLSGQCHQIANGAVYDDPEERDSWTAIHDAKLDALTEIFEAHSGQNVLVAYWFRHDLARLLARWPDATVLTKDNTAEVVDAWNLGLISKLFVQPTGNSFGLNMQHGGHTVAWYSLPAWSQDKHAQLIGRLRRADNASDTITVHYLIAQDTIDVPMHNTIIARGNNQKSALDWLRAYAQEQR